MELSRLAKDELTYELKVRGVVDVKDVESMRKAWRRLKAIEESGKSLVLALPIGESYSEVATCERKCIEIRRELATSRPRFKKIETTIAHLFPRIERISVDFAETLAARSALLLEILELSELAGVIRVQHDADDSEERDGAEGPPRDEEIGDGGDQGHRRDSTHSRNAREGERERTLQGLSTRLLEQELQLDMAAGITSCKTISTPVCQWNLKFTGDGSGPSVHAFIEEVNELREARNISFRELNRTAIDLFAGPALFWYRSIKKQTKSWTETCMLLKHEFLPYDYDNDLMEEIKARTQGTGEKLSLYVATMDALFNRLENTLDEKQKLAILMRNILPQYMDRLSMIKIKSIQELAARGRSLEESWRCMNRYRPPPTNGRFLEPDLRFKGFPGPMGSAQAMPLPKNAPQEDIKTLSCFGCGRPNTMRKNCPICSKNAQGDRV